MKKQDLNRPKISKKTESVIKKTSPNRKVPNRKVQNKIVLLVNSTKYLKEN